MGDSSDASRRSALGPTTITVGCVNFESVPRDKAATLEKMSAFVAEARGGDATSWSSPSWRSTPGASAPTARPTHSPCAWHRGQAELADGPSCRAVVDMAAAHGVHVIYGFEETGDADDRRDPQLGERRRARRARRHVPQAAPRHPARDRSVHARRRAPGVRHRPRPDRHLDLLRLLQGPRAEPGARAEGRSPAA